MLIVADIAGQFDALMRLVARVSETEKIILVGDLVDRGHFSFEVVDWAMKNQARVTTLLGNHEHMMLDHWTREYRDRIYPDGCWIGNGGGATIRSYQRNQNDDPKPPDSHIQFLSQLKTYYHDSNIFVSHAPWGAGFEFEQWPNHDDPTDWGFDHSLIWNRREPKKRDDYVMQVFGHNSHWGLRGFRDNEASEYWGLCIDQSSKGILTGLRYPELEVIEEPYVTGKTYDRNTVSKEVDGIKNEVDRS